MLPQSLLAFTVTLLIPLISAATPSCEPSNNAADLSNFTSTSISFCQKLADESFILDTMMYGVQKSIIAFQFTPQNTTGTNGTCNLDSCLNGISALSVACARDSHTIYGSGSTDLGCGTYNFTITEQSTPTASATATKTGKPKVGSTALSSGGSIVRGSGYTFVGVACVFTWLL